MKSKKHKLIEIYGGFVDFSWDHDFNQLGYIRQFYFECLLQLGHVKKLVKVKALEKAKGFEDVSMGITYFKYKNLTYIYKLTPIIRFPKNT